MKRIKLTQGKECLVDDNLYNWLSQWNWYYKVRWSNPSKGDAVRTLNGTNGRKTTLYMHQILCPAPPGYETDHKDTNTLNNQLSNLRIASKEQQGWNRQLQKNNTSGVKGVYWHKRDKLYRVQIRVQGKKKYIGGYKSLKVAIKARDKAVKQYHGEFARLK